MTQTELLAQWQGQTLDVPKVSLEYVRYLLKNLERETKREKMQRDATSTIAFIVLVWALGIKKYWYAAAVISATAYFCFVISRQLKRPEPQTNVDVLTFYRGELERKLKVRSEYWRGLALGLPGLILMLVAGEIDFPQLAAQLRLPFAIAIPSVLIIAAIENRFLVTKLQREIDALKSLRT